MFQSDQNHTEDKCVLFKNPSASIAAVIFIIIIYRLLLLLLVVVLIDVVIEKIILIIDRPTIFLVFMSPLFCNM